MRFDWFIRLLMNSNKLQCSFVYFRSYTCSSEIKKRPKLALNTSLWTMYTFSDHSREFRVALLWSQNEGWTFYRQRTVAADDHRHGPGLLYGFGRPDWIFLCLWLSLKITQNCVCLIVRTDLRLNCLGWITCPINFEGLSWNFPWRLISQLPRTGIKTWSQFPHEIPTDH